jgi:predicted acetyltransferase
LHIRTDIGDGRIALCGAAPPAELAIDRLGLVQLLFGYRMFGELRESGDADARGISDEVLAALFPRNDGYCFWPDRY